MSSLDTTFTAVRANSNAATPSFAYPYAVSKSVPTKPAFTPRISFTPESDARRSESDLPKHESASPVQPESPRQYRDRHASDDGDRQTRGVVCEPSIPAAADDVVPEHVDTLYPADADLPARVPGPTDPDGPVPGDSTDLVSLPASPDETHNHPGAATKKSAAKTSSMQFCVNNPIHVVNHSPVHHVFLPPMRRRTSL